MTRDVLGREIAVGDRVLWAGAWDEALDFDR